MLPIHIEYESDDKSTPLRNRMFNLLDEIAIALIDAKSLAELGLIDS